LQHLSAASPGALKSLEVNSLTELTQDAPTVEGQEAQSRIDASIRITIPAKKRKEALAVLSSMVEQTKLEEGCISCRLYRDVQEDGSLMLEEIWTSEKDLERHLRSDTFFSVLLVIEMATQFPEVRFDMISRSTGIDTIERVRANPKSPDQTNTIDS
jgi:quinol monooxygenase YgiN